MEGQWVQTFQNKGRRVKSSGTARHNVKDGQQSPATSHAEKIFSRFCFQVTHYTALKTRTSSSSPAPTKWEKDAQDFKCFFLLLPHTFSLSSLKAPRAYFSYWSAPCGALRIISEKPSLWVRELFLNGTILWVAVQISSELAPLRFGNLQDSPLSHPNVTSVTSNLFHPHFRH